MSTRVKVGGGGLHRRSGPRSRGASHEFSPMGLVLFGLVFLVPGLLLSWFLGVRPLLMCLQARQNWERVPAEVTESSVRTHRGSDSTTYSIEISYTYEWEGQQLSGDRYDFMTGSSSGYQSKRRVVERYPVGFTFDVYVNPSRPEQSVIDPSVKLIYFGMLGFGGIFFAVGLGTVIYGLRKKDGKGGAVTSGGLGSGGRSVALPLPTPDPVDGRGNVVLKPKVGPWTMVLIVLVVALFWNGIVSIFLMEVVRGWLGGGAPIFMTLFLLPFLLIGLAAILGFFYSLLAAFNPRVLVVIGPGSPQPGIPFTLDWAFSGSTSRLQNFTIRVIGEERATYRQGTSTYTDARIFYAEVLADLKDQRHIDVGSLEVTLPMDAMYSVKTPNNEIAWKFEVHGHIAFWPDVNVAYPFVVKPQPARFA